MNSSAAASSPCARRSNSLLRQVDVERALLAVELDDVAVAQQRDRAADCGFRADMADAEAARAAGEAAVGDQRDLAAHALAVERRGGREHLAHAGTAVRALVADDQHVAFLVLLVLHRLEAGFFAIEAARRTGECKRSIPATFTMAPSGARLPLRPTTPPVCENRLVGRIDDVLIGVPLHRFQILGDGAAGDGQAVAMEKAMVEQRLHQQRNATSFEHVFGDIAAGGFKSAM